MVTYKLDSYYYDKLLNPMQQDRFLKQEIIRIVSENKYDAMIIKYSEYVRKLERFSEEYL